MDSRIDVSATIEGDMRLKREVCMRLYDYKVKAGDYGSISVGVYLKSHAKAHLSYVNVAIFFAYLQHSPQFRHSSRVIPGITK